MAPTDTTAEKKRKHRLKLKRERYARNLEHEREAARLRASRRRLTETQEDAELRTVRHRAAQQKYRSANRLTLKVQSWQYRMDKKWRAAREREEAEYETFMRDNFPDIEPGSY